MKNDRQLIDIDDSWLNLEDHEHENLFNPMALLDNADDDFHYRLLWLMSKPEYFSFICKYVFNINILPSQALFLCEMWNRRFPMLIASRGFGKLLHKNEKLRVKNGWTTIENIQPGDSVYGSDGKLCNVTDKTSLQRGVEMYKITLRDGRTIEACEDHMWKIWDKNINRNQDESVWSNKTTKDLLENYKRKRKGEKSSGTEYRYALPINKPLSNESKKHLPVHPYVVGVLLGDGCVTTSATMISSADSEIVDRVESLLPEGYTLSRRNDKDFAIIRTDKSLPGFHKLLKGIGIHGHNSHSKFIPEDYQYGSYDQRLELVRGLMDTDGYAKKSVIEYYTVSSRLSDDFLNVARSLGLHCKHSTKQSWYKGVRYADCNRISIYTKEPIFALSRKLDSYINHPISKQGRSKYGKVFITNIEHVGKGSGYCISVDNEDNTYITKDYIVTHNSFILSLYAMMRALLMPSRKVVVVGAAFRQSKVLFEYMETIWNNAPVLRSMCDANSGPRRDVDRCVMRINKSRVTCLPLGDGTKIRGQRANDIISDEFASIPREIFETVVAGFAAVSSDPIANVRRIAAQKRAKELGLDLTPEEENTLATKANQIILSGTAYFDFNHFAEYWKKWKAIIRSQGQASRLREVFTEDPPKDFNWRDYSVIRIPYELLPEGFMDASQVARTKATVHAGIYQMEFGACFTRDSFGFFKRTLIESCVVVDPDNASDKEKFIYNRKGEPICFTARLMGTPKRQYVFGVDPASEVDNFSIVILEQGGDHRKIVYSWTTSRDQHIERVKAGFCSETDFYSYCARKIRDLMKIFPCIHIAMDKQGGGIAVGEALHDTDKIQEGELPIWEVIDEDKPKDSDDHRGLHILEMCQFADYEWLSEANHGLRKDFEDKVVLFPMFDPISLGIAGIEDSLKNRLFDTLEQCVMEIEDLKDELAMIEMTETPSGRGKWDTPETVIGAGKKGKVRKDRYSSLLMANMAARQISRSPTPEAYESYGGFATVEKKEGDEGATLQGPSWIVDGLKDVY